MVVILKNIAVGLQMAFKVLSIDGGGVRGIYPAYILKRIEESFTVKLYEIFDMVVGTSTGAIIASAIAVDYPLKDVAERQKAKYLMLGLDRNAGNGCLHITNYILM